MARRSSRMLLHRCISSGTQTAVGGFLRRHRKHMVGHSSLNPDNNQNGRSKEGL